MENEVNTALADAKSLLSKLEGIASSAEHKVSGEFNTAKQFVEKAISGLESHLSLIKEL